MQYQDLVQTAFDFPMYPYSIVFIHSVIKHGITPWKNLSLDDRVNYFSEDLTTVWKIHGFRDGNISSFV